MRSTVVSAFVASVIAVLASPATGLAQATAQAPGGGACHQCKACSRPIPGCEPPNYCTEWGHEVTGPPYSSPGWTDGHFCEFGESMCWDHDRCYTLAMGESDLQELKSLLGQVERGDVEALAQLLEKYPDEVRVRPEDRALLIVDPCESESIGEVYRAAIQLSEDQFRSFGPLQPAS